MKAVRELQKDTMETFMRFFPDMNNARGKGGVDNEVLV